MLKQEQAKGDLHVVNMVVQRTHYLDDKLMEALAAMPTDTATNGIHRQASSCARAGCPSSLCLGI